MIKTDSSLDINLIHIINTLLMVVEETINLNARSSLMRPNFNFIIVKRNSCSKSSFFPVLCDILASLCQGHNDLEVLLLLYVLVLSSTAYVGLWGRGDQKYCNTTNHSKHGVKTAF